MDTKQPVWKLIDQLGDVNPLEYGGYFIYEDTTGVYAPEGEKLAVVGENGPTHTAWRFPLDKCHFTKDGALGDNKFHPDLSVWFNDGLQAVAGFICAKLEDLKADFCSDDILARARAYEAIGEYHGFDNLDSYPLVMTRHEAAQRYA